MSFPSSKTHSRDDSRIILARGNLPDVIAGFRIEPIVNTAYSDALRERLALPASNTFLLHPARSVPNPSHPQKDKLETDLQLRNFVELNLAIKNDFYTHSMDLSPDKTRVVLIEDGKVTLRESKDLKTVIGRIQLPEGDSITACRFGQNNQLIVGTAMGTVRTFEILDNKKVSTNPVPRVQRSPYHHQPMQSEELANLISGLDPAFDEKEPDLFDLPRQPLQIKQTSLWDKKPYLRPIRTVAAIGNEIIAGGSTGYSFIRSDTPHDPVLVYNLGTIKASPDQKYVALTGAVGNVSQRLDIVDVRHWPSMERAAGATVGTPVRAFAFHPTHTDWIALGGAKKNPVLFFKNLKTKQSFQYTHSDQITAIVWKDPETIIFSSRDGKLAQFSVRVDEDTLTFGELVVYSNLERKFLSLEVLSDNKMISAGTRDVAQGVVDLWGPFQEQGDPSVPSILESELR